MTRRPLREARIGKAGRPDPLQVAWVFACLLGAGVLWVARRPRWALPVVLAGVLVFAPVWVSYGAAGLLVAGAGVALRKPRELRGVVSDTRRRWGHARLWRDRMLACGIVDHTGAVPRARAIQKTAWGERVLIDVPDGMSPDAIRKRSPDIASTFKQKACRVREDRPGRVWLDFSDGQALTETIPAVPIPEVMDLSAVEVGKREDGEPWTLELMHPERGYQGLFVAGMTGAGKSKVMWGIVRQLGPGLRDGTVELWVIDGKEGVEFDAARPLCARYAGDETAPMAALLSDAVKRMRNSGARMREQGISQHVPTRANPLLVLFVDEIATLIADNPDGKEAKAMERDLRLLLRLGRALGVLVVASTQDPSAENFALRKFFYTALGLRVRFANQVAMIYGPGAREAGATNDKLRLPGMGFVMLEDVAEPALVRSAFVTNEEIAEVVRDFAVAPTVLSEEGAAVMERLAHGSLTPAQREARASEFNVEGVGERRTDD